MSLGNCPSLIRCCYCCFYCTLKSLFIGVQVDKFEYISNSLTHWTSHCTSVFLQWMFKQNQIRRAKVNNLPLNKSCHCNEENLKGIWIKSPTSNLSEEFIRILFKKYNFPEMFACANVWERKKKTEISECDIQSGPINRSKSCVGYLIKNTNDEMFIVKL